MSAPFTLAPLPWDEDALAPTISANTISFHYHKHHKTYVDTLNKLAEGTRYADMKLEEIVRAIARKSPASWATSWSSTMPRPGYGTTISYGWRSLDSGQDAG